MTDRLRVIEGGQPDKPKRNRKARTLRPWECRVCEPVLGVRSRGLVKVRYDAQEDGQLRISGGRDIWVCAMCLAQGRWTPQTS